MVEIIKPQNERDLVGFMVGHYKDIISTKVDEEVTSSVIETIISVGENVVIEEGTESSPGMLAFLLKYYSK